MLEKVEIRTKQGVLLTLPLLGEANGYIVQDIQGLDPVKAEFVSTSFAELDGEQEQAARRGKRNVVFVLEFDLDFLSTSVSERRNYLYQIFIPKTSVHLRFFETGGRQIDIYSKVESILAPRFSKDPVATISLLSFDPDFYIPTPVVVSGTTVSNLDEISHNYVGTVDTGYIFQLNVNRLINEFTIYHRTADDILRTMEFNSAEPLLAGDTLRISTIPGNKYVVRTRDGVDTSLLYTFNVHPLWTQLQPGNNSFRVQAEGTLIPFTITYTTKIGGL